MKRRKFTISHDESYRDFSPRSLLCSYEVWVAAGATVYAADQQGDAADKAARGGREAAQLSREQYEQQRRDQIPYMQAGTRSLAQLDALNSGDYSSFHESPDYQITRDEAIKGLDRSAAQRGTQYSGGQLAALADYSGGIANKAYDDYYNRIYNLAGLGQNAAAGVGNAGMAYAGQAGNAIINSANTRAEGQIAQASTYANLGNQLSTAFGKWYQNRQPKPYGGTGYGGGMNPSGGYAYG